MAARRRPKMKRKGTFQPDRRWFLTIGVLAIGATTGCESFMTRADTRDEPLGEPIYDDQDATEFVGELADAWGMNFAKVESVALVTDLDGTGSDPPISPQRTRLVNEMKTREVGSIKDILAAPETSMVIVQGYMPPGIKKGENYDIFVQVPSRSRTSSLRGGHLMPTRLRPMQVMGAGIRTGHVLSNASGPVHVDALYEEGDEFLELRGVVLGGGVARESRPFGLVVYPEFSSVETTTAIAGAINSRFNTFESGTKRGVATPKDDELLELVTPSAYRHNLGRFIEVIKNIAVDELPIDRVARIEELSRELMEPFLSARAAIRLEAIGEEGVSALLNGLRHRDLEVRFHSAEALAYLGHPEAAAELGRIAQEEPAFRWHALTALAAMDDVEASIALSDMLHSPSAETRYGAFRAMHARSPGDSSISGQVINQEFHYHVVASNAEPMIHFARSRRPEIVLFGHDQTVSPDFLYVQPGMTVKGMGDGSLEVSIYDSRIDDQKLVCSNRLDDLLRTMMRLGASYEQLLELVRYASNNQMLNSRFVIDAVPQPGRDYERPDGPDEGQVEEEDGFFLGRPLPNLFRKAEPAKPDWEDEDGMISYPSGETTRKKNGFFARMTSWWPGS